MPGLINIRDHAFPKKRAKGVLDCDAWMMTNVFVLNVNEQFIVHITACPDLWSLVSLYSKV